MIGYNPTIVTDGLVLYLDAKNPRSYPGSGTTWYDLSGRGHDGTLLNNTSLSGSVMSFDGSSDNVLIGNDADYNGLSNITIETIAKFKRLSNYEYLISNARDCCGTYNGFELRMISNGALRFSIWNGGIVYVSSSTILDLEEYYHITSTYDGNYMKIYINSALDATYNTTYGIGSPASFDLRVGAMGFASSLELQGEIAFIKVYNRALTEDEIKQNFNATRGRFGL
jgi:hypothetical protein